MATRQQARSTRSSSRSSSRNSARTEQHPPDCQCPEHRGTTRSASSRSTSSRSKSSRGKSSRTSSGSGSARSSSRSTSSARGNGSTRTSRTSSSRKTASRANGSNRSSRSRSSSSSRVLTDHDEIRQWAEERNAQPSCVRGTGRNTGPSNVGMIRLDFPGYSGEQSLEPIEWEQWFGVFDDRGLALLVQDETAGGQRSNFNKLVSRENAQQGSGGKKRSSGMKSGSRSRRAA